jgi:5,10-methylene-tetrahydrofolate dehydrogenase/methenyl tetrahydrofolate cyclohydrolase
VSPFPPPHMYISIAGRTPGLAVVLIGDRKDSATYVRMKKKACLDVGIRSFDVNRTADVTEAEVVTLIKELNANEDVHGTVNII